MRWAHIEPLIPPGKPGGGKRRVAIREVINGVMFSILGNPVAIAIAYRFDRQSIFPILTAPSGAI